MVMSVIKEPKGEKIYNIIIIVVLGVWGLCMLIPIMNLLSISLSHGDEVNANHVFLLPRSLTLVSWQHMLTQQKIWNSMILNIFITVVGTFFSLLLSSMFAFSIAKKGMVIRKLLLVMIIFTMIFKAPMIPYFITLKNLGMYNSVFAMIIPHLMTTYNIIILRSFFMGIPKEMEEAAKIEGCGYFRIWIKIIMPLSKPVLATVGLFYAVTLWNQFLHPILFIVNEDLFPLQLRIREFIAGAVEISTIVPSNVPREFNSDTLKAATVLLSVIPILMVYPFIQRFFVKGAMLGSIKG